MSKTEEQACYYPDGTLARNYKACSTAGGACCYIPDQVHHDACYSNGLCQSLWFGRIYRGTCTDKVWGGSCPNICPEIVNAHAVLRFCNGSPGWCCDTANSKADCCSEGKFFVWNNATLVNYAFSPKQTDYTFKLAGAYVTESTTVTAATSPSTTGATSSSPHITSETSLSAATASTVSNSTPHDSCPSTPGMALGAGLGAGLGVPLLAVSAMLIWVLAKQRYHSQASARKSIHASATRELKETHIRYQPDTLQYEYVGGLHKWEKPQLDGKECRAIAELK